MAPPLRDAQKGMAVIAALIVVTVASLTATSILERQSAWADTLAGERDRVQAKWLLRGGVDWARLILHNDARNNAVTLKNAIWAQPIAGLEIRRPSDGRIAYFSGQLEDEQGKYNVSRLASGGSIRSEEIAALSRLLRSLDMPSHLAGEIAEWVADSRPRSGGEASATPPRDIPDLIGLPGMTPEMIGTLTTYLTVLPADTALNVNTAPPEVLSACIPKLDLAQARVLLEERDRGVWFTSRGDFLNRLEDPSIARDVAVDVRSNWFKVNGLVKLDHATVPLRALLRRPRDGAPLIEWMES